MANGLIPVFSPHNLSMSKNTVICRVCPKILGFGSNVLETRIKQITFLKKILTLLDVNHLKDATEHNQEWNLQTSSGPACGLALLTNQEA